MLRAFVRAVLLEDDETLKKWALADGDPIEKALAAKGIVPIHRGQEQTSKLGAGQHNVVLDVVYQGKRAVARVAGEMSELDSLLDFVAHAKSMPAKYHKHFPTIYKTFDLEVETEWNIQYYYGAVVEMLDPLPAGLEFDLDYQSLTKHNLQRSRVQPIMNDNWVVDGIIDDASKVRSVQAQLLHMFEDGIRPKLLSWVGKPLMDFDEWLTSVTDRYGEGSGHERAYSLFNQGLLRVLKGSVIPHEPNDSRGDMRLPDNHASKAVRDFYEFLQALNDIGMKWGDLHTGNFMVRRKTGDFVIVDPGYFDSGAGAGSDSGFDPPSGS